METTRLIEKLEIKVLEIRYGCQDIKLVFNDTSIVFGATYMGICPLSSLITLIAEIDAEIEYKKPSFKRYLEWLDEPGGLLLEVKNYCDIDDIVIKITGDDCFIPERLRDRDNFDKEYHFQVRHELLKSAVVSEASRLLKQYGIRGYNENWCDARFDEFPVSSFLRILGNKTTYDNESETYASSLEKEIKLLNSIL